MTITEKDVLKTANLAKLRIPKDKINTYVNELSKILNILDDLSEVDTSGIKPLINVSEFDQILREDEVTDGNYPEKIFKNAPKEIYEHFVVPKVIE